jgi:hypothetical protein
MKSSVAQLLIAATSYLSCALAGEPEAVSAAQIRARAYEVQQFEERFLDTLDWQHSNKTVKLVGFKKITMNPGQLADLERHIAERPGEWAEFTSAYYDQHARELRVYFPVEGALLHHEGELVEATHMGEFPNHHQIGGDCAVVGRYKTEQVHGIPANRIENGIVYLAEPAAPVRTYGDHGNVYMYDFGWREGPHAHDHGHDDGHHPHTKRGDDEHGGGSCKQNHGGKVCSQAYNINNGRCPRDYKDCIDYNGWPRKNCNNHSDKTAFIGSDCFDSVARGHCWNEI